MAGREIKPGTFLTPAGEHIAAWRHPSVTAQSGVDFDALVRIAEIAEAGKFDFLFAGDVSPNSDLPPDMLGRSAWLDKLDPLTVLSAVAARTSRIACGCAAANSSIAASSATHQACGSCSAHSGLGRETTSGARVVATTRCCADSSNSFSSDVPRSMPRNMDAVQRRSRPHQAAAPKRASA